MCYFVYIYPIHPYILRSSQGIKVINPCLWRVVGTEVRLLVWVELEALLIRVDLEVSRTVIGDLCPAPGHPIHSHIPRQEEEYEQAILSSF